MIGDLFDVTPAALVRLDEWEGIDPAAPDAGEYRRVRATVFRAAGPGEACWIYEVAEGRTAGRPVIASGDWLAREAGRA